MDDDDDDDKLSNFGGTQEDNMDYDEEEDPFQSVSQIEDLEQSKDVIKG